VDTHRQAGQALHHVLTPTLDKDRLPTLSAAQALEELSDGPPRCIPTGVKSLDALLGTGHCVKIPTQPSQGGIQKGQVTELWGPPGAGKTAFG